MVVRFVVIGRIVDHHCITNFLFMIVLYLHRLKKNKLHKSTDNFILSTFLIVGLVCYNIKHNIRKDYMLLHSLIFSVL